MNKIVIFSGAGISAESGLKTFRAADGLWEDHRIEQVATPEGWDADPELVLRFYNERRRGVVNAQPNAAHRAIAALEGSADVTVITQNIDDLHERAGSRRVIHLHGEILKARSSVDASLLYDTRGEDIRLGDCCAHGSQLRPHVVWFGEAVEYFEEAALLASAADIFLVVGTSLAVYPAAALPRVVKPAARKYIVTLDLSEPPPADFIWLREKASAAVPRLVEQWCSPWPLE
jgi:NAD-dependent deacetylase